MNGKERVRVKEDTFVTVLIYLNPLIYSSNSVFNSVAEHERRRSGLSIMEYESSMRVAQYARYREDHGDVMCEWSTAAGDWMALQMTAIWALEH